MLKKLSSLLLLAAGLSCQARHDGRYLHELNTDYATPHLNWGAKQNDGKIKALFIGPRYGAREAVEATQRMDITMKAVIAHDAGNMAVDSRYDGAVSGTSINEKTMELMAKLEQKYDLFVIGNFNFDKLPAEAKLKILRQVMDGSGLLFVYIRKTEFKRIFSQPTDNAKDILALADPAGFPSVLNKIPAKTLLKTYQLGKGRITQIDYKANHGGHYNGLTLTAPNPYSNRWQAEYENNMTLVLRAMQWTAGHDPQVEVKFPNLTSTLLQKNQEIAIELKSTKPFNGELTMRLRDEFNTVLNHKTVPCELSDTDSVNYSLPILAEGRYYLDVIVCNTDGVDNFGYRAFSIVSPSKVELKVPALADRNGTITGEIKADELPDSAEIELSLTDSPYGNVWFKSKVKPGKFELKNVYNPTLAAYLRCTVKAQGKALAFSEQLIFFPEYAINDYLNYVWGGIVQEDGKYLARFQAIKLVDELGWNISLNPPGKENIVQAALQNQQLMPYITRITLDKGKNNQVYHQWGFLRRHQLNKQIEEELKDDCSFASPKVRQWWAKAIELQVKNMAPYAPAIYNLGDENRFSYEAGFGPYDLPAFRDFLKEKYGTITAYNDEHNSKYTSFDQIPQIHLQDAKNTLNYPAWFDHRQYMEKMYADLHHFLAAEIKKYAPHARVGAEGSQPGDLEQTIKNLEFWGPYSSLVMDEVLRSIAPEKIRTMWWGGYVGSHGGRNKYPLPLWNDLLLGTVNGSAWFSGYISSEGALGADMDLAHYVKKLQPYMRELQDGKAQLLINTPLKCDGIAILWSHAANSARLLDSKCVNPEDSTGAFIRFCYNNALNFDFITAATIARLKNYKILFLFGASAISTIEKTAILEFVKNGGTVIADVNPGIMNEYLRPLEQSQLHELFGSMSYSNAQPPEINELKWQGLFKGKKLSLQAAKSATIPHGSLMSTRKYGKGTATLLNFTLSGARATSDANASFDHFMLNILNATGIKPCVKISGLTTDKATIRVRERKDFKLLGVMSATNDIGKETQIQLDSSCHIYMTGEGYLGYTDKLSLTFDVPFKLISCFKHKQTPPAIILQNTDIQPGRPINISLEDFTPGTVLLLEIQAPNGKFMDLRRQVLTAGKKSSAVICFAFSDPPGNYSLRLTDIATGLRSEKSLVLKSWQK
jgi:hypothetical protein